MSLLPPPDYGTHTFRRIDAREALIFSLGLVSVGIAVCFASLLVWQGVGLVAARTREKRRAVANGKVEQNKNENETKGIYEMTGARKQQRDVAAGMEIV